MLVQVNSDMTDSVGPGKLVRHMHDPSYAYDGLSLSYASVYVISLGTSFDIYKSQNSERICLAGLLFYIYICLLRNTRQCGVSAVWANITQHMC